MLQCFTLDLIKNVYTSAARTSPCFQITLVMEGMGSLQPPVLYMGQNKNILPPTLINTICLDTPSPSLALSLFVNDSFSCNYPHSQFPQPVSFHAPFSPNLPLRSSQNSSERGNQFLSRTPSPPSSSHFHFISRFHSR